MRVSMLGLSFVKVCAHEYNDVNVFDLHKFEEQITSMCRVLSRHKYGLRLKIYIFHVSCIVHVSCIHTYMHKDADTHTQTHVNVRESEHQNDLNLSN